MASCHTVTQLDILIDAIGFGSTFEIVEELLGTDVCTGPTWISLPREGIGMSWDIARAASEMLAKPRAGQICPFRGFKDVPTQDTCFPAKSL